MLVYRPRTHDRICWEVRKQLSAIACLYIQPTEAVCNVCAKLTPVVEPASDRIYMDWSGCGAVPVLAQRLAENLAAAEPHPSYRLGVAPVRFVAELLAGAGDQIITAGDPITVELTSIVTAVAGGYYVDKGALPAFIRTVPFALLPDIDDETKHTLGSLAVDTLGELRHVDQDLLRGHIGGTTGKLLAWMRGHDPRPVAALYPPEKLHQSIPEEALLGSFDTLRASVTAAAATLADQLRATGRAMAQLTITGAGRRQTRTFTPPVTDSDQIARAARQMAQQLLTAALNARDPQTEEHDAPLALGDFSLEIVPTDSSREQMSLWDQNLRRSARVNEALDAVRDRFSDIIVRPAAPREAVARYEAMFRLYEVNSSG